jgi:hypothetical protein
MDEEGMINVWVDLKKQLEHSPYAHEDASKVKVRETGVDKEGYQNCPPLNIVIFIVGSRGELELVSALVVYACLRLDALYPNNGRRSGSIAIRARI